MIVISFWYESVSLCILLLFADVEPEYLDELRASGQDEKFAECKQDFFFSNRLVIPENTFLFLILPLFFP